MKSAVFFTSCGVIVGYALSIFSHFISDEQKQKTTEEPQVYEADAEESMVHLSRDDVKLPEDLLKRLRSYPGWSREGQRKRLAVYKDWIKVNPMAAMDHFRENVPSYAYTYYHEKLIEELFQHDPITGMEYAVYMDNSHGEALELTEVLKDWPSDRLEDLEPFFSQFAIYDQRASVMEALVYGMVEMRSPEAAMKWIENNMSGNMEAAAHRRYFNKLSVVDPLRAYKQIKDMPASRLHTQVIPQVARQLAKRDMQQAVGWYENLPNNRDKKTAYVNILEEMMRTDLGRASVLVEGMPESPEKVRLMSRLGESLADTGIDEAARWVQNFDDTESGWSAFKSIIDQWSEENPIETIRFIQEQVPAEYEDSLITTAVYQLVSNNFEQAGGLILSMEDGRAKNQAAFMYAQEMYKQSDVKALEWIDALAGGQHRDMALRGVIMNSVVHDNTLAIGLSADIRDDGLRQDMLKMTLSELASRDPVSARNILSGLNISTTESLLIEGEIEKIIEDVSQNHFDINVSGGDFGG